ncbi:MAG: antibiotic biosynthesis monooxygenase [Saprospiraceae bacterium]|nr:antibiotic biosynthesis monooxygenase [Saprospiraceae bacterium]
MIRRIVKMKFREDKIQDFIEIFEKSKPVILEMEGCHEVELWKDNQDESTMFTISKWDSISDLNNYRNTDFFISTWKQTKSLFFEKAEAWSLEEIISNHTPSKKH